MNTVEMLNAYFWFTLCLLNMHIQFLRQGILSGSNESFNEDDYKGLQICLK